MCKVYMLEVPFSERKTISATAALLAQIAAFIYFKKNVKLYKDGLGKPCLDEGYVSISHSGRIIVCTVCYYPIGIDVEVLAPLNSPLAEGVSLEDFYVQWTVKEAYAKMLGKGIYEDIIPQNVTTYRYGELILSVSMEEPHNITVAQLSYDEFLLFVAKVC